MILKYLERAKSVPIRTIVKILIKGKDFYLTILRKHNKPPMKRILDTIDVSEKNVK